MTASNLSICVGPSILWSSDQAYMMDQNYSKEVSTFQKNRSITLQFFPGLCFGADPD